MCNSNIVKMNFKIGILKELHERELIDKAQLEKAIKLIMKIAKEEEDETSSGLL